MVPFTSYRPAGYSFLIKQYQLKVLPHWHASSVRSSGTLRSITEGTQVQTSYPPSYWPGEKTGDHLEFALKYDGINLGILSALFKVISKEELAAWVALKPTGKYTRTIWFLYEFLTGEELPLQKVTKGNYISILDNTKHYALPSGKRVPRQRVINNLLGEPSFCPIIRRTEKLKAMDTLDFQKYFENLLVSYSPELLQRALGYLYNKETTSSFEIEHIKPSTSRIERFIQLLEMAEYQDFCEKKLLLHLQNQLVDPRFQDQDYRKNQNYIAQTSSHYKQIVHYVSPKPEDLPELMEGLLACHKIMKKEGLHPLVHGAIISYGFVFLHPFEDGNGRIHRFLIHNILALRQATPRGLLFPISATMLKNMPLYDQSLESFSKPLMRLMEYHLDDSGEMTVQGETASWYRYMDMTAQVEALYDFVKRTGEEELLKELDFLAKYDQTKQALRDILDMPDRLIDLFIRLCLQGKGFLSAKKRKTHFAFLTDHELMKMEETVREKYSLHEA
jgi:hypothetical protein